MMDTTNWPELTKGLSAELKNLRGGAPEVMKAFAAIAQTRADAGGARRQDQRADRDRHFGRGPLRRLHRLPRQGGGRRGATREEILETLGMAIYMGAGPSAMYASHALGAYTQFAAAKSAEAA